MHLNYLITTLITKSNKRCERKKINYSIVIRIQYTISKINLNILDLQWIISFHELNYKIITNVFYEEKQCAIYILWLRFLHFCYFWIKPQY